MHNHLSKRASMVTMVLLGFISVTTAHGGDIIKRDYLTGDWGGLRTQLRDKGLEIEAIYTAEYLWALDGGIRAGSNYRADSSLTLNLNTEKAGWWKHGTFFTHLQGQHGNGISESYVGDFQILSNIDADDYFQISEFWYRHAFLDGRLTLKLGKMEANSDFAYVDYGGVFINSSPGFSPTIPLVTYPDQDWGVVLAIRPNDRFSMKVGVFQGRSDGGRSLGNTIDNLHGPMVMLEPALHIGGASHPGTLRLGLWWNGDRFEKLTPDDSEDGVDPAALRGLVADVQTAGLLPTYWGGLTAHLSEALVASLADRLWGGATNRKDAYGLYATWDQALYKERQEEDEDEQGLGVFGQFGWSNDDVIEAEQYYGLGFQWTGAIPRRDDDILGLGAFHVKLSNEADFEKRHETTIELYYHLQLTPWFSMRPDVQYSINPGGTAQDDALVAGFRTEISF